MTRETYAGIWPYAPAAAIAIWLLPQFCTQAPFNQLDSFYCNIKRNMAAETWALGSGQRHILISQFCYQTSPSCAFLIGGCTEHYVYFDAFGAALNGWFGMAYNLDHIDLAV